MLTVPNNQTQTFRSSCCTNPLFLLQPICELRFWFSAITRDKKQHYLSPWHANAFHFLKQHAITYSHKSNHPALDNSEILTMSSDENNKSSGNVRT